MILPGVSPWFRPAGLGGVRRLRHGQSPAGVVSLRRFEKRAAGHAEFVPVGELV